MHTKLSVNINKIALLRNSRGSNIPDVLQFAKDAIRYGAEGITIHPREDERHIKRVDAFELGAFLPTDVCEYNIEGYPSAEFIKMVCKIKPTQVTLVPDLPDALTSSEGWDTIQQEHFLKDILHELKSHDLRVALFMETDFKKLEMAKQIGADRIEFYTGQYAEDFADNKERAIKPFESAALFCSEIGIGVNAGHDLNLDNLKFFKQHVPNLLEVSIGHALVRDCLYLGLENVIPMYKRLLND
ncbi:MAG: pyridoxine 5'-phosphate synthase [Bacteroidetes bacterium]|nr:pyridoxine 5'-phosphate synthase [Bacteroidota bacterium]